MSQLAIAGSAPAPHGSSNVAEWIFSNPFSKDGGAMKHVSSEMRSYAIPIIPRDKPLITDPATRAVMSWFRAYDDTLRVAGALHALGLKPAKAPPSASHPTPGKDFIVGPVVMIHLPNCLPMIPLMFGIFAAGLTATLANPALTSRELAWLVQNSVPKVIVTTLTALPTMEAAIQEVEDEAAKEALRHTRILTVDPAAKDYSGGSAKSTDSNSSDWKALLQHPPLAKPVTFSADECRRRTAVILWSSGTTGKSKGVLLSHTALTSSVSSGWHAFPEWGANERCLGLAPFYHVFGLVIVLLMAPSAGVTIVSMPRFELGLMLEYIEKHKITYLHTAPPVLVLLANSPLVKRGTLTSLKGAVSGGAPCPTTIIDRIYEKLGFYCKLGYGLTETGSSCHVMGTTYEEIKEQHGTTGPPLYGVEVKIASLDSDATMKLGEEGEILIRSQSVLSAYYNNPSATSSSLDSDGWFRTGDIGKLDQRGYLWITDRLKEMIKVKGFQVAPAELEAILSSSDQVADAAVTSIYDDATASELPRAYIVPAGADLRAFCARASSTSTSASDGDATSKQMQDKLKALGAHVRQLVEGKTAHYKYLRGNVVFVDAVPKSPSGKILRRLLKDVKGRDVQIYARKVPVGEIAKL